MEVGQYESLYAILKWVGCSAVCGGRQKKTRVDRPRISINHEQSVVVEEEQNSSSSRSSGSSRRSKMSLTVCSGFN